jgi:transcriptional regulator with XRE-family HTH domain
VKVGTGVSSAVRSSIEGMTDLRGLPRKYAPQLARARARLTVSDEVGLALRAHRRALGLSQRSYAASRGLSRAMLARLEAGAGRMSLDTVVDALEGTGFVLKVGFDPLPPQPSGAAAEEVVLPAGGPAELPSGQGFTSWRIATDDKAQGAA